MAAGEATYYNLKRLHRVFAVSSVALLAATVAMIWEDHARPWKAYQRTAAEIEVRTANWRKAAELAEQRAAGQAVVDRWDALARDRRSSYVVWDRGFPLPGKRLLELPFLDALNSPRRIETLWNEELTQDFHFTDALRLDRCTTCHQAMDSPLPGAAAAPRYPSPRTLQRELVATEPEAAGRAESDSAEDAVEQHWGLRLAGEGLHSADDVTIAYVRGGSPAARAGSPSDDAAERTREEIWRVLRTPPVEPRQPREESGLWMGDVITAIDGVPVAGRQQAIERLWAAATGSAEAAVTGQADKADGPARVRLTIRRGLPHPFAGHPRLDLFVAATSPHPMSEFGCTICHGGQGSATAFEWASHTPHSEPQRQAWRRAHGWFDNEYWKEPMLPRRFVESGCLKCHHRVLDLGPSPRFPDPPAAKLLRGREVISKYGCFGCHEIHGFAGQEEIGPDLRTEPDYAAAAQQLRYRLWESGSQREDVERPEWVRAAETLAADPEDAPARRRLGTWLEGILAAADATPGTPAADLQRLRDALKDVEHPGMFRKPGPSLRHVGQKLDSAYLSQWLADPQRLRPGTRMPRPFGQWSHLEQSQRAAAASCESVEQQAIAAYLEQRSQPVPPALRPEGITSGSPDEQLARGKSMFQTQGCLACHPHRDFADAEPFRDPGSLVAGPDLTRLPDKLRGRAGRQWLYDWLKQPATYDSRTIMPALDLPPVRQENGEGQATATTDPVADLVAYLLGAPGAERPPAASSSPPAADVGLRVVEHLSKTFPAAEAAEYAQRGIPQQLAADLPAAELELVVPDQDRDHPEFRLSEATRLLYLGRKSIARYGCYGCHDIPGFEGLKPIGIGLNDWGRKDPSQLAFGSVVQHVLAADPAQDEDAAWYLRQLRSANRIGFLQQKLKEPRSFDHGATAQLAWNDRLRMPQFALDSADREAVMTFVLGLVAQPPRPRYVCQPDSQRRTEIAGREILDKYSCLACHLLEPEQWRIAFPAGQFGEQARLPTYPFADTRFGEAAIQASRATDRGGRLTATLVGIPSVDDDGQPLVFDDCGDELFEDETYRAEVLEYAVQLWKPALLDGHPFQVGEAPLNVPHGLLVERRAGEGGFLARYLLPHVVAAEKRVNRAAKGSQAWGWLPPPLWGQGARVQPGWLERYLREPTPIRPAAVLKMPAFNLSLQEARALAQFFLARESADPSGDWADARSTMRLQAAEAAYQQSLKAVAAADKPPPGSRFDHAMRIVVDRNYCVTCHLVGDYDPQTSDRAKAPDLAAVYMRLRPDWVRRWIAKPTAIAPFTAMGVNIPFDPQAVRQGGIDPRLYHGTSTEQLDALVDLLINFDVYAGRRAGVNSLVQEAAQTAASP